MNPPPRRTAAFSLVEITLALGVMAFCLVAIFGLLPVGFNSDRAAVEQTAAAGVAAALAADLRQTPAATVTVPNPFSPRFLIKLPAVSDVAGGASVIHTLFLTEDGAIADSYNPTGNPPTSAEDKGANSTYNPRYRVTLVFSRQNAAATDRSATSARLLVTWPATADPSGGTLPKQYSGSFETMLALDRN